MKCVKVTGFCFYFNCGFTIGRVYEIFTNFNGEEYAIDDEGRTNFSIHNCVRTINYKLEGCH